MKRALPYALFAAVTLAVFWKFLLYGHTLFVVVNLEMQLGRTPQEPSGWFRPGHSHARVADNTSPLLGDLRVYNEGLKAGELRLWNPTQGCGYPIYADPMAHPFYPPQALLHLAFRPEVAYEIFLLLHLFFSGTVMLRLARALGRSEAGATVAGLVWMLLGYHAMWFSTGVLAGVSVFGPLALLGILRGLERRDMALAALSGTSMGLAILGSHPQHALHFFLFLVAWLAFALRDREKRAFAARFATAFVLVSVGVGLAALLTRLDTLENGWRAVGRDFDELYGRPWRLLAHLFGITAGKAWFPENPALEWEFTITAGLAATTLAVAGAARGFREGPVRFLAIFGAAALLAAFVRPAAAALQVIPILNLSPASRWVFVAGFCLALLAARGTDALAERAGRVPLVLAALAAASIAVLLAGAGLSNGAAWETLIGFALAAAAAFALGRKPVAGYALGGVALLFELLPPFLLQNWHADPAVLGERPEAVRFAEERERAPWRGTGLPGSVYSDRRTLVLAELMTGNGHLSLYGVENVAAFTGILPAPYVEFGTAAGGMIDPAGRSIIFGDLRSKLLDAANLRYLFLPADVPIRVPPRFQRVREFGGLGLYENTGALPRAHLVSRVIPAGSEAEAARLLRSIDFNPRTTAILETPDPPTGIFTSEGSVEWLERTSDRLALKVVAGAETILVLSETHYPGWEAEIDGREAPIYRANVAFRAVRVPAGGHVVKFRFRPESVRTGMIGSAAFLALALGYAAALRLRRRA